MLTLAAPLHLHQVSFLYRPQFALQWAKRVAITVYLCFTNASNVKWHIPSSQTGGIVCVTSKTDGRCTDCHVQLLSLQTGAAAEDCFLVWVFVHLVLFRIQEIVTPMWQGLA